MLTFKKLLDLLTPHERRRAALLFGMILVMALLDVIGVASIMPFMVVLANPALIESNAILKGAYQLFGFTQTKDFLFFLGVMVFVLLVTSLSFKALTTYAQLRFTLMREYSIGKRLIEGFLHQPYVWFLNRHSADLGKTILSEVNQVVYHAMLPIMIVVAQGVVSLALLSLLLLVDPTLALVSGLVLSVAYLLIFQLMKKFLSRIGKEQVAANGKRFSAVSEAFGAIKEVKLGGLEQAYIDRFAAPAEAYAKHQASAQVVSQLPRFVIEAIAFGGMLLVMLYLMARKGDFASALPIVALYAFAGYRLMPALQQMYGGVSQLRFVGSALDALHADLMSLQPADQIAATERMALQQGIEINNVQFSYPNTEQPVLNGISLSIPAQSTIALVGTTGSGKTTTVDLILGLLKPQKGTLSIDGQIINASNRRQWQKAIGYVPQHIYLADDTVATNIAFGVPPAAIDMDAVIRAAKIANLHDFISKELPQGYATTVGERGVRLSGGQRQRIGIARALYHDPAVLILDEATSALDNLTEQAVMEAVNHLSHKKTIILIAHRLSTVRQCDCIYLLDKGKVKAHGTYEQLQQEDETFRAMTGNTSEELRSNA